MVSNRRLVTLTTT